MKSMLKLALLTGVALSGISTAAFAQEGAGLLDKERFMLRGRIIGVFGNGDGVVNGTALGTDVDNYFVPELDITYFLTNNVALELIAATSEHTVKAGTNTLGDTWVLPPTLTLQYHFMPDATFSPYVGAGINYTVFYSEDDAGAFTDLKVDGGFGYAVQAGFDYWLSDNWGFNADVKYIDIDADVSVNPGSLHAYDVDIDPWVVGVGVSYRF